MHCEAGFEVLEIGGMMMVVAWPFAWPFAWGLIADTRIIDIMY